MDTNENSVQASDEPMRNKNEQLDELLFRMDTASSMRRRIEAYNELAALLTPRATADVERDAARYRWLLENYARGDGYTDIDEALNNGEPEKYLSPAIDEQIAATKGAKPHV